MHPGGADRLLTLPLLFALLLVPFGCDEGDEGSEPDAVKVLERMLAAEDEVPYRATKRMEWGSGEARHEREYEVTHWAGGPTCFDRGERRVRGLSRLYWLRDQELLLSNYRVAVAAGEPFLGRGSVRLEITGRREGRPSMDLTVDRETGLLLSTKIRDYEGRVAFRAEFSKLELEPGDLPEPPERRTWKRDGDESERMSGREGAELKFAALSPRYLPEGYVEKNRYVSCRRPSLRLFYGDGLSLLEISERPARPEDRGGRVAEQRRYGSRTRYEAVIGDVKVRLTGQLSPEELLKVLESMAPVEE